MYAGGAVNLLLALERDDLRVRPVPMRERLT